MNSDIEKRRKAQALAAFYGLVAEKGGGIEFNNAAPDCIPNWLPVRNGPTLESDLSRYRIKSKPRRLHVWMPDDPNDARSPFIVTDVIRQTILREGGKVVAFEEITDSDD